MGRPSNFNDEIADEICAKLAVGMSLKEICRGEGMPDSSTVFRWLAKEENASFRDRYARAKEAGMDALAEEILDIADNATNDWMDRHDAEGNTTGKQFNAEAARRSQIRIDARKWLLAKLAPKKYGDRVVTELTGKDGGPVQFAKSTELTDDELAAIAAGRGS